MLKQAGPMRDLADVQLPAEPRMAQESHDLQELLQRIERAASNGDPVQMQTIVEEVGRRSFGGLLLMAGVIGASPLSGIPAVPTTIAVIVLVVSGAATDGTTRVLASAVGARSLGRAQFHSFATAAPT